MLTSATVQRQNNPLNHKQITSNSMKKIIYLFFVVVLFSACSMKEPVRYTSSSPEIEVTRSILKAYADADWDAMTSYYADTAKILNNVPKGKGISIDAAITNFKQDHELFSAIGFVADEDYFEMVLTDDGETWVNYWGLWVGTLRSTGEKYEIPLHITMRFENQKVVLDHGYWNNADIVLALYKLEAQSEQP
jgi:uncharacterized protein